MVGTLSSLMIITAMALIMPTALYSTFTSKATEIAEKIVAFSRGTAFVLLVLYLGYLYFQLKTHKHLFLKAQEDYDAIDGENNLPASSASPHTPTHSLYLPIATLTVSSVGMLVCTYFFIESIHSTSSATNTSESFIATILIPIASNSPEGAAVIFASRSGNVDFAISIIVGSILQISLFVIPLLVMLGWIIQREMTLNFGTFHTVVLFFSVLIVNHVLREGKYTYLHGSMLVGL
jgi:Ca2+:H+ antiporter